MDKKPLRFQVAPHIVQDLGLNLYTSLPRVLVEFVANAYDADSPGARIYLDLDKIQQARKIVKKKWELEIEEGKGQADFDIKKILPLEERTLPCAVQIVIKDTGQGMSRADLQDKFLVAGRRRREEENSPRSTEGRILMGRKGLGKLAGFGIAHTVTLISRKKGEGHATRITLDYEELIKKRVTQEVVIPDEILVDGGQIDPHGTTVILSNLVYEPMKSGVQTIAHAIGDHFSLITSDEFDITLNDNPVTGTPREFVYAYPQPSLHPEKMIEYGYKTDDGIEVSFQYRIRFTGEGKHLTARERGVRVYAHKRLASAPDLLELSTGIHGFRNTHYLDGVVSADFIDDNPGVDYIATDRHTLRWESALLTPMREFLTDEMKDACNEYQKVRDEKAGEIVKKDPFTSDLIEKSGLPQHRKRLAYRFAAMLAPLCEKEIAGEEYRNRLSIFMDGLGQGDILKGLKDLAAKKNPDFDRVVAQMTDLTARELGDFMRFIQGRLDGIDILRRLYKEVDFRKPKNENKLHELLKRCPWLINPTFSQFLTSNRTENELNARLAKELKIGTYVSDKYDPTSKDEVEEGGTNKRPDLVFLLSNKGLRRVVIVELKAPNTYLHIDHLQQLKDYVRRAEDWLSEQGKEKKSYKVEGYLIGSKASANVKSEKVAALRYDIEKEMEKSDWTVFDIGEVLEQTEAAHQDLLDVYSRSIEAEESASEERRAEAAL